MIGLALPLLTLAEAAQQQKSPLPPSPPEALQEVHRVGACVADRDPTSAGRMLAMDYTTVAYRKAMDRLVDDNRSCFARRSWMRSNRVLIAGAIAERLLSKNGSPVNVQLARAASRPAVAARSPSDQMAICIVRSVPDDVARLFASPVASEAEAAAATSLSTALSRCTAPGPALDATPAGLRSILATAAYRSVWASAPVAAPSRS